MELGDDQWECIGWMDGYLGALQRHEVARKFTLEVACSDGALKPGKCQEKDPRRLHCEVGMARLAWNYLCIDLDVSMLYCAIIN